MNVQLSVIFLEGLIKAFGLFERLYMVAQNGLDFINDMKFEICN